MPSPEETNLMMQKIKSEKIPALYHFTDIDNLPLIAQLNGLYSKEFLEQNAYLKHIKSGGNTLSKELDIYHGNWDKVSLSWCAKHPMAYSREQKQHLCYVIVDLSVALEDGIIFTDRNAADSHQLRTRGLAGLNQVNFDAVRADYPYPTIEIKKQKQAEILIPHRVEMQKIKHVVFRSPSSFEEAKRICSNNADFTEKFTVADRLFYLPNSYVQSHFLTSAQVTPENVVRKILPQGTVFKNKSRGKITLVVGNKLVYGTEVTAKFLSDSGKEIFSESNKVSFGGEFWSWYEAAFNLFNAGDYRVEFYLSGTEGDIRQFLISFSVID